MSLGTLVLFCLAYGTMYALPLIFFKRGTFNLMWCLTSSPYAAGLLCLLLSYFGVVHPFTLGTPAAPWLDALAVPFAAGSIALQVATMAVHRVPLALWHQPNDPPQSIVTWGPYGRVRHPFYVAFLILMTGTVIAAPHWTTLICFAGAITVLTLTAKREERRLLGSDFGAEYAAYLKRTGRFLPRLSTGES